ncbi:MAG: hypothetical protein ACJ8C4_19875 [Gemmataceae bacterium]
MTPVLRNRVVEIYRRADAAVAGHNPICQKSGKCCRFTEYGHTLFLSDMEAEILLDQAVIRSASRDNCPFQIDGLCTARDQRPLGCRIYFCDVTYAEAMPVLAERFNSELKKLADEFGHPWRYAPLHEFLRERVVDDSSVSEAGRVALNVVR